MSKDLLYDRYGRFYELPEYLQSAGLEVTGVCLSYYPQRDRVNNKKHSVEWRSFALAGVILPDLYKYILELLDLVKHVKPDVVVGASDALHVIIAKWLGKKFDIPCVIDLYDNFESYGLTNVPVIKQLYLSALRDVQGISMISDELLELIVKKCKPKGVISVIGNAVPEGFYANLDEKESRELFSLPQDYKLIGTAGALHSNRGIIDLYCAFLALSEIYDDIGLVLAGTMDPAISVPTHERVFNLGQLDYRQVPNMLNSLDVGIICNERNKFGEYCFPQKFYEMLACKIPIIAANTGALSRLMASYNGCLYEPGNVESLVSKIQAQLRSPLILDIRYKTWPEQGEEFRKLLNTVAPVVA